LEFINDEPIAEGLNNEAAAPPFMVAVNIPFPPSFDNPYAGRVDPFPAPQPPPSSQMFPEPFFLTAYSRKLTDPTIQQWNFTIERQITNSFMARASYEGWRGIISFKEQAGEGYRRQDLAYQSRAGCVGYRKFVCTHDRFASHAGDRHHPQPSQA